MFLFSYLCRVPPLELSWPNRPMPLSHPPTMQLLPMSSRNRFCSCSDSAQLNHITLLADATVPIVDLGDASEDELGCSPSAHPKTTCSGSVGTWKPHKTGNSGNAEDPLGLSVRTPVIWGHRTRLCGCQIAPAPTCLNSQSGSVMLWGHGWAIAKVSRESLLDCEFCSYSWAFQLPAKYPGLRTML